MYAQILRKTLRVPLPELEPGEGATRAHQLDSSLMLLGFKLSAVREIAEELGKRGTEVTIESV